MEIVNAVSRERAALVALLRHPDVAWSEVVLDVHESGGAVAALERVVAEPDTLFSAGPAAPELIADAAAAITDWEADGTRLLAFFDDEYPAQLRDIREMPPILFARGDVRVDDRAVAVVGSRSASAQGLGIARGLASALAERGVTVASGLAAGIDTAAHLAALEAGGRTVAVIGTGIRRSYPAVNWALQQRISEVGLVLSQFWPDASPTKQSFPMRNAVMSGYSAATIVVEAGEKSGARIQARLALAHGRPVVLTTAVLENEWAKAFVHNPGVYVAHSIGESLDIVDKLLIEFPIDIPEEHFPDLVIR